MVLIFNFLFSLCSGPSDPPQGLLFGSLFCLNRLGFTDALQGLTNKRFPTLFPENYSFAERKNFIGNALQSDGIKRGSPPLRLENQPVMAGMDRMSGIKRI